MNFLTNFINKFKKAYRDSQIWTSIETPGDLKRAYEDSYQKPVVVFTASTMHFRSDYIIGKLESQARKMDFSRIKFYKINLTGNSKIRELFSQDLGIEITSAMFLLFRDGQVIFKRVEEVVDMERLMKNLFEE